MAVGCGRPCARRRSRSADGLAADDGIVDRLGLWSPRWRAAARWPALHDRLLGLQMELSDLAQRSPVPRQRPSKTIRERLAEIGARRQLLTELRRKYGDTLAEVMEFREQARTRVTELEAHDERARLLEANLRAAEADLGEAEARPGASAPSGRWPVRVGDRVESCASWPCRRPAFKWRSVQIGPARPSAGCSVPTRASRCSRSAKVASGGELARAMLAVRLPADRRRRQPGRWRRPATLVFDEVDAGIGGEAAVAVGHALAALGQEHQVLVVTHLPQVAAFGDRHLVVRSTRPAPAPGPTVEEVGGRGQGDRTVEDALGPRRQPDGPPPRRGASGPASDVPPAGTAAPGTAIHRERDPGAVR